MISHHSPLINRLVALSLMMLFALLLTLGAWQWQRGDEKQQLLAQQQLRQQQPAHPFQQLLSDSQGNTRQLDSARVTISGALLHGQSLLLDNQHHQHRLGFHHLAALQYQPQSPLLLVDFGWLPAPLTRQSPPDVMALPRQLAVSGTLYRPRHNSFIDNSLPVPIRWPLIIQQLDLPQFGRLLQQPLHPWVLRIDPDSELGYVKSWPSIAIKPQKHYAYAVQWFAMALALALLTLAYIKRYRHRNRSPAHAVHQQ